VTLAQELDAAPLVNLAPDRLDRRFAVLGIIVSVTAYGLLPIVTAIKEE
jgi:hypothetical protein